jgi:hypothetical protein
VHTQVLSNLIKCIKNITEELFEMFKIGNIVLAMEDYSVV